MIHVLATLLISLASNAADQKPYYTCKPKDGSCTYHCPFIDGIGARCLAIRGSCESSEVKLGAYHQLPDLPKAARVAALEGAPFVLFCKQVGTLKPAHLESAKETYQRLFSQEEN